MIQLISRVLKDILTTSNGEDFCHSKTIALVGFIGFLCFSGYDLWKGSKFDAMAWSGGVGTLIVAGAGGAKIKETTERTQQ